MSGLTLFVWLTLSQLPTVQVSTLAGEQHLGTLETFSSDTVVVKTDAKSVSIPAAEVLLIRSNPQATAIAKDAVIEIRLVDQSRIRAQSIKTMGSTLIANHPQLGELRIPVASVSSVRLAAADAKIDPEWNQLLERSLKKDLLAIRKGDLLDHLDGIVGTLNETKLQFQLDGDDIAIAREKVFGFIYSKRESLAKKTIAVLDLASGDRLSLKQVSWTGKAWTAQLVTGLELEVAHELFQSIDYSQSRITYLSDVEPRAVKHTPYFDLPSQFVVNEYRRDKNFDGSRIRLGEKTYAKGLAIHSQTQLKYRLGGDYRRFQAVMGIGDEVPVGDVEVIFRGDNKVLFKSETKATEASEKGAIRRAAPQLVDLDVTGIIELEIFVDFGSDKRDIGDRLYLGNARLLK